MISGQDGPPCMSARPGTVRPEMARATREMGRALRTRSWLGCGLFVLCIGSVAGARAQERFRVSLVQPKNSELVTRVEGQTRDLGVEIEVVPDLWRERTAARAAIVAAERGADFLVRVDRARSGALEVRVYGVRQRTLRARRVPPQSRRDRLGSSAELEAAALVLRGELSALIEAQREAGGGGQTGATGAAGSGAAGGGGTDPPSQPEDPAVVREPNSQTTKPVTKPSTTQEAKPEREREDVASQPDAEEPEDEPEEPEEPDVPLENYNDRPDGFTLRGGMQGSLAVGDTAAFSALIGGRLQLQWATLGLAVSTALPFELDARDVRIRLHRHAATAEALAVVPWGPRLRALFGIDAGVVLYARTTEAAPVGFERLASDLAWSPTLGVQAELQWLVARNFGLALGAGLRYVLRRTAFAYTDRDPNQKLEIAALARTEPWLSLTLFGLFDL